MSKSGAVQKKHFFTFWTAHGGKILLKSPLLWGLWMLWPSKLNVKWENAKGLSSFGTAPDL
jgi:hypothetical protein